MSCHKRCPIPFTQLYLHSSGEVYPCSFAQNYSLGNVKEQSLMDIWKGERLAEFRKSHLAENNSQCEISQKQHACHLHHDRLNQFAQFDVNISNPPVRLDFMVDSFCNLKCVMCTNVLEDNGGYEHDSFWDECAEKIFPFVKEIEIIGGEPFLIENSFRLVDLVSVSNPDCLWRVTTNAHYKFNEKFKSVADKMNFESFAVSVDSLKPDVFAKIRDGAKLELVLETLDDWITYSKTRPQDKAMKVVVNFVVQRDNVFELPSFIDFCLKKGAVPYPILLRDPEPFSILEMEEGDLLKIFDFLLESQSENPHPTLALVINKTFKELGPQAKLSRVDRYSQVLGKAN